MRKLLIFALVSALALTSLFKFTSKAEIIPDEIPAITNVRTVTGQNLEDVNVFRGRYTTIGDLRASSFFQKYDVEASNVFQSLAMSTSINIINTSNANGVVAKFVIDLSINDGEISEFHIYIQAANNSSKVATIVNYSSDPEMYVRNEVDMNDFLQITGNYQFSGQFVTTHNATLQQGVTQAQADEYKKIVEVDCVLQNLYKYADQVDSAQPRHRFIYIEYGSNLSIDQILGFIRTSDRIDSSVELTYDQAGEGDKVYNKKSTPGEYSMRLIARDASLNTTVQYLTIVVQDTVGPKITQRTPIQVSYTTELEDEEILAYFSFSDPSGVKADSPRVERGTYGSGPDKVGVHNITISASDEAGRTSSYVAKIQVIDDVKPTLTIPVKIISKTEGKLTTDEIASRISVFDEVKKDITVSVTDVDGYGTKDDIGSYTFKAYAIDNGGNSITASFEVLLVDGSYPSIDSSELATFFPQSHSYTLDQIISILNTALQERNSSTTEDAPTVVNVTSSYFDIEEKLPGEYPAKVELSNGEVIDHVFYVVGSDNIEEDLDNDIEDTPYLPSPGKPNAPTNKTGKYELASYIFLGIAVVSIIGICYTVVHKRTH